MKHLSYIFTLTILAGCLALLQACRDDIDIPMPPDANRKGLSIKAVRTEMLPQYFNPAISSRGTDPKLEEEKAISSLHVFFFDPESGNLLTPTNGEINFRPYQHIQTNVLAVPQLAFTTTLGETKNAIVYAVANVPGDFSAEWAAADGSTDHQNGTIVDGRDFLDRIKADGKEYAEMSEESIASVKSDLAPYTIRKISDLENWVYMPELRSDVSKLPEAGMPMTGKSGTINVAQGTGFVEIPMKALMARVDISVDLQPNQQSQDGSLPTMTINEYGVKNMPVMVPFSRTYPDSDRFADEVCTPYPVVDRTVAVTSRTTINAGSPLQRFTYYTYENIQNRNPEAVFPASDNPEKSAYNADGSVDYPSGITTDEEKQRWKPQLARTDRASALVLRANYVTHQGLRYDAEFTVYMGKDAIQDFRVVRNCQYNNDIVISGLDYVRNSASDVYTFDGRVNVKTENPIYLAMVNERKVDAHASVRPVDIWFLLRESAAPGTIDWHSEVTFEILDADRSNWIRMESVPAAQMAASGYKAGTGCRDYFTTDLVTNTLQNNGESTDAQGYTHYHGSKITLSGDDLKKGGSRSRIYFYIDENTMPVNTDGDIPDRTAQIRMTYTRTHNGVIEDTRTRIIEIEQRGLLKVTVRHPGYETASNRDKPEFDVLTDTYIEQYEEYLEHYDPLDKHEMPGELYEGLPWGVMNKNYYSISTGNKWQPYESYNSDRHVLTENKLGDVYNDGLMATQWILYARRNQDDYVNLKDDVKLYNEASPSSAYHYCYGKNKRNADGSVPNPNENDYKNLTNGGWYLPGIRELERALVQYYVNFEEFRDYFYWSAAADKDDSNNYARATKAIMNNGVITYAESRQGNEYTDNNGTGGRTRRSTPLRIRAFYRLPSNWKDRLNKN